MPAKKSSNQPTVFSFLQNNSRSVENVSPKISNDILSEDVQPEKSKINSDDVSSFSSNNK